MTDAPWVEAIDLFRDRHPRRRDRLAEYEALLDTGVHLEIGAEVLAGRYVPEPPSEAWLNKAGGRRKRLFLYEPRDELLLRLVNLRIQPAAEAFASPWCRSFLPAGGARAAFRNVLTDPDAADHAALRIDVRDYFNAIDVADLLAGLPACFVDGPVGALLRSSLLDRRVRRDGAVVDGGRKGVMAGTPIAPVLATLYLRDLDHEVAASGVTYARYSDDLLVLGPPDQVASAEQLIRTRLAERGLEVNEEKSGSTGPGEPWDFLGFRYERGTIDLAPNTIRKLKAKTTRLARHLLRWRDRRHAPADRVVPLFLDRSNRRLYGTRSERSSFSWATWFLPMLDTPASLGPLDRHLQREARYAATGRRTERARALVPYPALVDAGHLPLVSAFWALRTDPTGFDDLVARRTGIG
ncbi:MAG TPA: reverse transcriptase domain-containing protein [Acidimicrobiales bacterium]|nr:reverse transcriptase domain-containing protein [Acidimicrobiales bacterium]